MKAKEYAKLPKRGEYQYVSGIMGISYIRFLSAAAGGAYKNVEVVELLKLDCKNSGDRCPEI